MRHFRWRWDKIQKDQERPVEEEQLVQHGYKSNLRLYEMLQRKVMGDSLDGFWWKSKKCIIPQFWWSILCTGSKGPAYNNIKLSKYGFTHLSIPTCVTIHILEMLHKIISRYPYERNSKLTVRSKILGTCIGASMTLRRGTSLDVI